MFCGPNCARKYRNRQAIEERRKKITAEAIKERIAVRDINSPDSEYLRLDAAADYLGGERHGCQDIHDQIVIFCAFITQLC